MRGNTEPEAARLDDDTFRQIVRHPLVSIDLIVRDRQGRALLGLRANEPATRLRLGEGGRIYEHLYETNRFGEPGFGTHYVVLAYEIVAPDHLELRPDAQHRELAWWRVPDLLASPEVDPYAKAYFAV